MFQLQGLPDSESSADISISLEDGVRNIGLDFVGRRYSMKILINLIAKVLGIDEASSIVNLFYHFGKDRKSEDAGFIDKYGKTLCSIVVVILAVAAFFLNNK